MKIAEQGSQSFFIGGLDNNDTESNKQEHVSPKNRKLKSFRAEGCLKKDPAQEKKALARRQASKIVSDVYSKAQKIDADLKERSDRIDVLKKLSAEAGEKIHEITERKDALKEEYGITEDSEEYQDLLLLEKKEASNRKRGTILTPEENARLAKIDQKGTTEFQEKCLNLDREMAPYRDIYEKSQLEIREHVSAITNTKIELLKDQSMLKATKSSENIMAAASREAIGMMVEEGKAHLDKNVEEEEETSQKREEKKEEQKERIEAIKEKVKQLEAIAEGTVREESTYEGRVETVNLNEYTDIMVETDRIREDVQAQLQKMLAQLGLSQEDLKGLSVDEIL